MLRGVVSGECFLSAQADSLVYEGIENERGSMNCIAEVGGSGCKC